MRVEPKFRWKIPAFRRGAGWALGVVLLAGAAREQPVPGVEAVDFKVQLENYAPPYEAQPRTLLESAKVQPQPGGLILMTDAQLKAFSTNGTLELLALSPHCDFDSVRRTVSSPGPLQLHTGDGRFFTEGLGFLWDQTNSTLLISNHVHTVTRKGLLPMQASSAESSGNIDVISDWFLYTRNSGLASYHGHVRVTGTNLLLTADNLLLELPATGSSFKTIVAEGHAVIDRGDLHALGDKAVYLASNDVVTLTGHPSWRMGGREGRGDELVLDRTTNVFRATGHAYLKLPRDSAASSLWLTSSPDPAGARESTNRFFEIFSDDYELSTNLAVFRREVRGSEFVENKPQGKLSCGLMTVWLSGSNRVQNVVAQDQVVVEQNDGCITAEKAVFSATNSASTFTGKPTWQSGPREGSGDVLILDRVSKELRAQGNARMRLPADQIRIVEMSPSAGANRPGSVDAGKRLVDISSDAYDLRENSGVFQGNVHLRNPQGRLFCDLLTASLSQGSGEESRNAVAERRQNRVEIVWLDAKGQTNYSWSDKAVYGYTATHSVTNELVTLSGDPVVTNPQGTHTGDPIVWDRVRNTVYAANEKSEIASNTTNTPDLFRDRDGTAVTPTGTTNGGTSK
jgi:lipopolysaccharide export system protein LptA